MQLLKIRFFTIWTKTKCQNRYLGYYQEVSNQDESSNLNTDPQLAETIITDRNSKEHTQNKVHQKELFQLKKYFSSFTKIETKLYKKYFNTKK